MRTLICAGFYAAHLLMPLAIQAQSTAVAPRDRIRVTTLRQVVGAQRDTPDVSARHTGNLVAFSADSLLLDVGRQQLSFPLASVLRLEVSRGRHYSAGPGALVGAGVGGLLLGMVAFADESNCEGFFCFSPGAAFAVGFGLGALSGALVGAIVGSGVSTERWVEVPVGGGMGIKGSVGFRGGGLTISFGSAGR